MGPVLPPCRTWNVSIQFVVCVVLHACHWSTIPSVNVHRMDITAWSVVVHSFLHKKETNSGKYKSALCWQQNWHTYIIECVVNVLSYHFLLYRPIKLRKLNHTSVVGFPKPFLITATVNFQWHLLDLESSSVGMHQMRSPAGVWSWARKTLLQPSCWGSWRSGWIPNRFYKWKTLDFGSVQMSSEDIIF